MTFSVAATKPPIEASDLEKVPAMMSTSSVMPKCAAVPSPLGPEHAEGVGVVERQRGAVLPGHPDEARDVGDVAFHRVDAVHDDHRALARAVPLHPALEVGQVAVVEALGLAVGHLGAVDDRGVVELVEVDDVAPADQPGDEAEVGGIAGREDEAGFLAQELGEGALELLVEVERAVQEPAAGAARAVPAERPAGGLEHLRVVGQAEVVVRPQHDPLLSVDDDDGVFRFGDRLEVRIEANRLELTRLGELRGTCRRARPVEALEYPRRLGQKWR